MDYKCLNLINSILKSQVTDAALQLIALIL